MPLGDSITDGFGTPGGYRIELFRKTLTAGQHITFVGRNVNGPATVTDGATTTPFPQRHEGYSGYTIDPGGRPARDLSAHRRGDHHFSRRRSSCCRLAPTTSI